MEGKKCYQKKCWESEAKIERMKKKKSRWGKKLPADL